MTNQPIIPNLNPDTVYHNSQCQQKDMSCVIFMLEAIRNQALLCFQVDHDSYVSEIPEFLVGFQDFLFKV